MERVDSIIARAGTHNVAKSIRYRVGQSEFLLDYALHGFNPLSINSVYLIKRN